MSYPSEQVVKAFIESYLRKKTWSVKGKDDTIQKPSETTEEAHKLDYCVKILQKIDLRILPTKEWIALIDMIYDLEKQEQEYLDSLWFHRRWFGSQECLHTLKAIRSYILTNIADASDYLDHLKELNKLKTTTGILYSSKNELNKDHTKPFKPAEIEEAKKAFDAATAKLLPYDLQAIKDAGLDHLTYFNKYILAKDAESVRLSEKTFDDLVKNANQYARNTPLCKSAVNPVKPAAEPAASRPANPPIAAPAPEPATRSKKEEKVADTSALRANSVYQQPTSASSSETHRRKTRSTAKQDADYEPPRSSRYGKY